MAPHLNDHPLTWSHVHGTLRDSGWNLRALKEILGLHPITATNKHGHLTPDRIKAGADRVSFVERNADVILLAGHQGA